MRTSDPRRSERGQAGVETVVLLPLVVVLGAAALQLVLLLGSAAVAVDRAAVRGAQAAERGASVEQAVRAALPEALRRGLRVSQDGTSVRVRATVRPLLPLLPAIALSGAAS